MQKTCLAAGLLAKGELLLDVDNNAGTHGAATLTDSETQALLDGDGGDQLDLHVHVIARHTHLCAFRKSDNTCYVSGSEIELRTLVVEERSMTSTLVLSKTVNLT